MASLHLQILLPLGSTWRFFIFTTFNIVSIIIFVLVPPASSYSVSRSLLQSGGTPPLVFLPNSALQQGAVCLDGSIPAYIFDQGSGSGQNNWIVHLEGGGWCSSSSDCLQRSTTDLGSSKYMSAYGLGGYLSRSPTVNPDFYNWNRVLVRYCDGGSFSGNAAAPLQFVGQDGQMHTLYFRGQKVWEAVMDDLLSKGMMNAGKAIHSGDSAGSLAAFHHCNRFRERMPAQAEVKCLCDAGFFMDVPNIAGQYSFRSFFHDVVALHSITLLPSGCTSKMDPGQCFFPQYNLEYINVPLFILQSPYDSFQVQYILAPPGSYANGVWDACRQNLASCSSSQLATLQDFRGKMLAALQPIVGKTNWGLYAISCYYHTLSEYDVIWNGTPKVNNMNIEEAFRMWFFGGALVQKIDCAYPCNPTCVNVS